MPLSPTERARFRALLIQRLAGRADALRILLADIGDHYDNVYRYYHHSHKVYRLQQMTRDIQVALEAVLPERPLNEWFLAIVGEGTGHQWEPAHNDRWLEIPRRIVEAYLHAGYFLRCAVQVAEAQYANNPMPMPSSLAALLELYRLR